VVHYIIVIINNIVSVVNYIAIVHLEFTGICSL